jgi:hypothetical protein
VFKRNAMPAFDATFPVMSSFCPGKTTRPPMRPDPAGAALKEPARLFPSEETPASALLRLVLLYFELTEERLKP